MSWKLRLHNELYSGKIYAPERRGLHIEVVTEGRGTRHVLWHRALPNPVVLHLLDLLRCQDVRSLAVMAVETARISVTEKGEKEAHLNKLTRTPRNLFASSEPSCG